MSRIGRAVLGSLLAVACAVIPGQAAGAAAEEYACAVDYDPYPNAGGLSANITIKNVGIKPVRGWTLSFPLNEGLEIVKVWNAELLVSKGQAATRALEWNAVVESGRTAELGFDARGIVGPDPAWFTVTTLVQPADGTAYEATVKCAMME